MTATTERDYVLGTHDDEIERLGLQHRVWRPRALDAWRRAGFTVGQTIMDVGCGPGYASVDLAEIVGTQGRVVAIDRSRRFMEVLGAARRNRGLHQIDPIELDLDETDIPAGAVADADGAWARWIFAFLKNPRLAVQRVASAVRPGGSLVIHEYFDYGTWRLAPRVLDIEDFVVAVMQSWRADGGEPDIALDLPRWLVEFGFEIRTLQPIVDIVQPSNYVWRWPQSFVEVNLRRLVELGRMAPDRARVIARAVSEAEATPHTYMITPAVLEIVAVRR